MHVKWVTDNIKNLSQVNWRSNDDLAMGYTAAVPRNAAPGVLRSNMHSKVR